jgi:cytochrome c oxidase subunit 1
VADTTVVDNHSNSNHVDYLKESSGIMSWLTTLDHKRISVMYIISIIAFFLVGGSFCNSSKIRVDDS